MSATAIDTSRATYTQNVGSTSSKPLTEDEARKVIADNHKDNLQVIENSLNDNSAGWGNNVTIRVPADKNGKPIMYPTEQDWINAAKNGSFVETSGKPSDLARIYYNTNLVDLGDAALNAQVNSALISEVLNAVNKGSISIKKTDIIPTTEGNVARAIIAHQNAISTISVNIGTYGQMATPPADKVTIKVPADASGKPIKNPTLQDWIDAEKNNRYTEVTGSPFDLSKDYFGVQLDSNWRSSYTENQNALREAGNEAKKQAGKLLEYNKDLNAGNRMDTSSLTDIDPQVLQDAMAIFGSNYKSAMGSADQDSKKMENLRKKYDAIKALENNLNGNSAGSDNATITVPKTRYKTDAAGNIEMDANGKPITVAVSSPPTNEDWEYAAEFETVTKNGRDLAKNYFGITYTTLNGKNDEDHRTNLSNNLTKLSNERGLVDSEMKKISGKFDFNMGNAQTILSMTNKMMSSLNDSATSIIRGI